MTEKGSNGENQVARVHITAVYGDAVVSLLTGWSCLASATAKGTVVVYLADVATLLLTMSTIPVESQYDG